MVAGTRKTSRHQTNELKSQEMAPNNSNGESDQSLQLEIERMSPVSKAQVSKVVHNRQVLKQHENLEPVITLLIEKALAEHEKSFRNMLEESIYNSVEETEETMRRVIDDLLGKIRALESQMDDFSAQLQMKMKIAGKKRPRGRYIQDNENASSMTTASGCCICSENKKCHKHRRQ